MKRIIGLPIILGSMIIAGCMSLEERLASTDYETRKDAEAELYANAIRTGSESEVLSAVKRMTNDEILAAVAVSDNPVSITKTACERINEDKWRSAVAVYGKDLDVQLCAVKKMNDQALLLEVYKSARNDKLKFAVIERLSPENVAKLPYSSAMAKRWKSISNQTLLGKIVTQDLSKVDESEWAELVDRITDPIVAEKLQLAFAYTYAERYDSLSESARKFLVSKLTDKEIIEDMITEPDKNELENVERERKHKMDEIKRKITQEEGQVESWKESLNRAKKDWKFGLIKEYEGYVAEHKAKQAQYEEELRKFKASAPRKIYVEDDTGKMPLYEKLGDDFIVKLANEKMRGLKDFHDSDLTKWDECYAIVQKIKSSETRFKFYCSFLSKIAKDESGCDGKSWSFLGISGTHHKWGASDDAKVQLFIDSWGLDKQHVLAKDLLIKSAKGGKYLVKYVPEDDLIAMIKDGKLTDFQPTLCAVKKISVKKLDMSLYAAIKNDDIKMVMMERMPAAVKESARKANEDAAKELIAKAKSINGFSLKGFYLGMKIEDAKRLVMYYLPKSNVVITKNNDIEIDVVHGGEFDVTPMYFCQADKSGRVYRFNFDKKRFLSKWFNYDVQDYQEWAIAFGKEFNFDFRSRVVKGKRDVENVLLRVTQETYQYKNNAKGCVVTYFGDKEVFDPNGETSLNSIANEAQFTNAQDAMYKAGVVMGVRSWVKNGWENADGAREGTLRIEKMKEN